MHFAPQLLFFLGAIGVFNSLIISLYFILNKAYKQLSVKLFGAFLFVLSLRVLKSLFYSFSTIEPISFLQSGPAFFLLIGPLLLSYILSYKNPNAFAVRRWKTHFAFWCIVVISLMIFLPFSENRIFHKKFILPIVNHQWLTYIYLSGLALKDQVFNFKHASITDQWLILLLSSVLVLWIAYFFVPFNYFVCGSILFSILFYAFCTYFFLHKKTIATLFPKAKKNKIIKTNVGETDQLVRRLKEVITEEKLYTNPKLKLPEVAQQLDLSVHELSSLINGHLEINFSDFLNQYRVEEAKELLQKESIYTIEAIGNQSGFNSKSAFYKAFKKYAGTTPAKYKAQFLNIT